MSLKATRNRLASIATATILSACVSSGGGPPHVAEMDQFPPGVNGSTTIDYYDVHGRTLAELRADMRRNGPKVADSSFVGETRAPMRWTWKTQSEGPSTCSIKDVTIWVNAQILLPRWTPPADTAPGVYKEWLRFMTALQTHESGHKDIAARAARELQVKLRDVFASCSVISTRAGDIARAILEKAHDEQRQYDADTRHGLTQGTGFGSGGVPPTIAGSRTVNADKFAFPPAVRIGTVRGALRVPVEKAWAALPSAYAALGLVINARDSTARATGDSLSIQGRFGDWSASDVIDCGSPSHPAKNDSVRVMLFVTTRLDPDSAGTIATNTVQAFTRLPTGNALGCLSRGTIERRLLQEIRRHVMVP